MGLRLVGGDQTRRKIFMTTVARWYCNRSHTYIHTRYEEAAREGKWKQGEKQGGKRIRLHTAYCAKYV